jgi:HTH-type transcriptional repressor of NAD biosynthesis genes
MIHGLVIGKFLPLHKGHEALIRYAASQCDELTVLLGVKKDEAISGHLRLKWLWETFRDDPSIHIEYTDDELPDSPVSSRDVSRVWADYLSERFPAVRLIVSSEEYGEFLAEYMGIEHKYFDMERKKFPVSGSLLRESPHMHWDYLAQPAKEHFVKKICIYGPESTGKSILTERLAGYYNSVYVPEVARDIIDEAGDGVTYDLIEKIGPSHGEAILKMLPLANRFLFVDTDVEITKLFSDYYFRKTPAFPPWVESANKFDLYIFTDTDVPYVEDPQRDSEHMREIFKEKLLSILDGKKSDYTIISGGWEERFQQAILAIEKRWPVKQNQPSPGL